MKSKSEITKQKIHNLVLDIENLMFPEFLQSLRKIHGLTRRTVCEDLKFSPMRMFWIENGYFKRQIPMEELDKLAQYYGIHPSFLFSKLCHFEECEMSKSQAQYTPKKKKRKKN